MSNNSPTLTRFPPNAQMVLAKRYLKKDADGKIIETIDQLFSRVAHAVASAEDCFPNSSQEMASIEERFLNLMTNQDFFPNSPTLMNAGKPLGQLSACFVLPVDDSMESIFDSIKNTALIHKSGGGTGFSFSRLRPALDTVATTSGVSSGPISFMKVFNLATEIIKQGGTRRGANMGILRVDHPDILAFIRSKEDNDALNNFNISVAVTNSFMTAVEKDTDYDLVNPRTQKVVGSLKARKVFNTMVERAWRNGEPGVIFLDRINRDNPTPQVGLIEATNPCGEQPLLPFESCNLGSINLANFCILADKVKKIDFQRLREVIRDSVRFLDNVIEINRYPIEAIEKMSKANRKIGLGVMGWADLLVRLEIPYDSEEAISTAEEIMSFIQREATQASIDLAVERGPFPNFTGSVLERRGLPLRRNATVTTIAPTGTISIIANCSSGIEPLFAVAFEKHVLEGERLIEVNSMFLEIAKEQGFYSDELIEQIAKQGNLKGLSKVPEAVKKRFVTAHDISPEWHIRMQAAFQNHIDNAVSKTVNFPRTATIKDVETTYLMAHKLSCKGVTVYRDGSRDEQVLNVGTKKSGVQKKTNSHIIPRPRPSITQGTTERVKIGCGNLYITVNSDENGICEVFTSLGRAGGCPSQSEAAARLISLSLRAGIDVEELLGQLKGIRCLSTLQRGGAPGNGGKVLSCPDAIGRAIEKYHKNFRNHKVEMGNESKPAGYDWVPDASTPGKNCPECSEMLEHEGGCVICRFCGYSKCG